MKNNTQLTTYLKSQRAEIRYKGRTQKDSITLTIHFDRYTIEGFTGDTHRVKFYLNESLVATVDTHLDNMLEVGQGEITKVRMQSNPYYFMTANQKAQVEAKTLTIRQAIEANNPTLAKFCRNKGIF